MSPSLLAQRPAPSDEALAASSPGLQPCPGLKLSVNAGATFADVFGRVYDLEKEPLLSPEEAAADPRMAGLYTPEGVVELLRAGRLYPYLRKNARVVRVFACALTDWRARQVVNPALAHLMQTRSLRTT
jgi:hypothetical protein